MKMENKVSEAAGSSAESGKIKVGENEASVKRWILATVVGLLIGFVFSGIAAIFVYIAVTLIPVFQEGGELNDITDFIYLLTGFAGLYLGMVLSIKKIAKTSAKSFILGAGRTEKLSVKREILPFIGLFLAGIIITSVLPLLNSISFRGMSLEKTLFIVIFALVFTWMQTSWEELLFRGIPLRMMCKNKINFSPKVFVISFIPSALFMLAHVNNPEVQNMSGTDQAFMVLSYLVPGIFLILCDLLWGNLLPGIVIHWINNIFSFVILSDAVSVSGATSIFVCTAKTPGFVSLIQVTVAYVPVLIYLFVRNAKKNRNG